MPQTITIEMLSEKRGKGELLKDFIIRTGLENVTLSMQRFADREERFILNGHDGEYAVVFENLDIFLRDSKMAENYYEKLDKSEAYMNRVGGGL